MPDRQETGLAPPNELRRWEAFLRRYRAEPAGEEEQNNVAALKRRVEEE